MNILLKIMAVGLSTVSVLGFAKDTDTTNIQIKNKSSQKVSITVRNTLRAIVVRANVQSGQAAKGEHDLRFLEQIVIGYLDENNQSKLYTVLFNHNNKKFDKVYLKFKLDTGKNGVYIPSLQPQEGTVFSRRTTLKNNIKKTDMTPQGVS
jgi:hypothetical protein